MPFTYSLSLMTNWEHARRATALARDRAKVTVAHMILPQDNARWLSPLARLGCTLGGSDVEAHPWSLLEQQTSDLNAGSLRGGHIQVRAQTLRPVPGV